MTVPGVIASANAGAGLLRRGCYRLQPELRQDRVELAAERVRFQPDDQRIISQPLDMRFQNVHQQPFIKHHMMRTSRTSTSHRLMPP